MQFNQIRGHYTLSLPIRGILHMTCNCLLCSDPQPISTTSPLSIPIPQCTAQTSPWDSLICPGPQVHPCLARATLSVLYTEACVSASFLPLWVKGSYLICGFSPWQSRWTLLHLGFIKIPHSCPGVCPISLGFSWDQRVNYQFYLSFHYPQCYKVYG